MTHARTSRRAFKALANGNHREAAMLALLAYQLSTKQVAFDETALLEDDE